MLLWSFSLVPSASRPAWVDICSVAVLTEAGDNDYIYRSWLLSICLLNQVTAEVYSAAECYVKWAELESIILVTVFPSTILRKVLVSRFHLV